MADNVGDWYDNRDDDHASIDVNRHPGAQRMTSGYGMQLDLIANQVVVGNASLAYIGASWGSISRVSAMCPFGASSTYQQYTGNNMYWYPEHLDHDAKDHYHAMTPAVCNSQGSSGSELDEVDKWLYTLAALPADVKEILKASGLLMPTLQMIFRRTRVGSDDEYLSGLAHPSAFDDSNNRSEMEAMAAGLSVESLPPMVQLRVVEDGYNGAVGSDFFEITGTEAQYDSPVSIARIFRGREFTRRMVVSAADSFDVNNLPLTYHWRVLRGDPCAVRITDRDAESSEVEIEIDYHPETTIAGTSRRTNLVVVGAFVHNGHHYSAPAFVTSFTLSNESRTYDPASGRLLRIDYGTQYVHPSLTTSKIWDSDSFVYGSSGRLLGWTRRRGDISQEFAADGQLVFEGSLANGVTLVQPVSYFPQRASGLLDWSARGVPVVPTDPVDRLSATVIAGLAESSSCVRAGETAVIEARLFSDCAVTQVAFGMAFDPTLLTIVSVEPSDEVRALRGGLGPEFWRVEMHPGTGSCQSVDAGVAVAMAESLDATSTTGLAVRDETSIATLTFETSPDVGMRTSLDVRFVSCLTVDGAPHDGQVYCGDTAIEQTSWEISLGIADECFMRGDCNGDTRRDISDIVTVLYYLFGGERAPAPPACLDACDVDDSGGLDITDALEQLRLFFEGEPGVPGLAGGLQDTTCWPDFTQDQLSCESSAACDR